MSFKKLLIIFLLTKQQISFKASSLCRLIMLGNIAFLSLFCHLLNLKFKKIFQENGLDPGQARHFVGPDMGPNCLQLLAADNKYPPKFGGLMQLLQRHSGGYGLFG